MTTAESAAAAARRTHPSRVIPVQVVVIAKEPVPGRAKTRLSPPYTPDQAAELASAALADTLDAVARPAFARRVVAFAGTAPPELAAGFDVVEQRGGGLDERLAGAFCGSYAALRLPVLLVGMDTPQLTSALLESAAAELARADAVLGPAADGGFWLLGLRRPHPGLLLGVPMSTEYTGQAQLERLQQADLDVRLAPTLTDVDTATDAAMVAAAAPRSRFAHRYAAIGVRPEAV